MNENRQLRIVIVGHVDHGKSTLVGRLIHETGSLPEGKLEAIKAHVRAARHAVRVGLPDGRDPGRARPGHHDRHRRRSGSSTPKRHYVIIDAPGHKEFLKNMVTGAASAEAALLLIDAARGRAGAVAPARLPAAPAGRPAGRGAGQQDGPGRLLGRPLRRGRRGVPRLPARARRRARLHHPDLAPARATTWSSTRARMPWYQGPTVLQALDGFEPSDAAGRAAAAPAGAGRLQVRPAADHRRPDRERPPRGRRRGGVLAVEQDRARSSRSRPGTCPRRPSEAQAGQSDRRHPRRADLRRARRGR